MSGSQNREVLQDERIGAQVDAARGGSQTQGTGQRNHMGYSP